MLYNILKDQWQTIEIDRIRSITQETEFSQMAELLYAPTNTPCGNMGCPSVSHPVSQSVGVG